MLLLVGEHLKFLRVVDGLYECFLLCGNKIAGGLMGFSLRSRYGLKGGLCVLVEQSFFVVTVW